MQQFRCSRKKQDIWSLHSGAFDFVIFFMAFCNHKITHLFEANYAGFRLYKKSAKALLLERIPHLFLRLLIIQYCTDSIALAGLISRKDLRE